MSQLNLIGTTLGRFEVISELGRGGMAIVYKARQTDLDRIVALKLLPPEMTHDTSYIARFRQEARSAARLEHPHIMPIYEVGEANGLHYIAMKYIQGRTLKDMVEKDGALSVPRAAQILAQVGDALDHAHRQGVIHRDIKPSNVMITDEDWIYLTDFGLARGTGGTSGLTMAGTVMGTPEYMSPEQAQGLPNVGPPTDIYALGVVLYELLTGTFPFQADTPMGMLAARLLQPPTPPRDVRGDLPIAVEDVIMRSLARKPEARFPSAAAMVSALRSAAGIGNESTGQRPLTPMAGMPAMGDTIRTSAPVSTPSYPTPQSNPPYVRPQAQTPLPRPQPQTVQTPAPSWQQVPATPTPLPSAPAPTKSNKGLLIGIGGVALLLVLALVVGVVFLNRPSGPDPVVDGPGGNGPLSELVTSGDAALATPGELNAAIADYQAAIAEDPQDLVALSRLAIAYNLRGDWVQAESAANNLVNAASSDDAAAALGLTLLADAIASQGAPAESVEIIQQALDLDDQLSLAHAVQSNILASQASSAADRSAMDTALEAVDRAVDTMGDEDPLMQALTYNAIAYSFSEEYFFSDDSDYFDQSEANYANAIDLQPSLALFQSNLGYLLSADGEYDDARDAFNTALELDADFVAAQTGIGWSYYNDGEYEDAREAFDAAIAINPDYYDPYFGQGRIAFDESDYATAVGLFEQAGSLNPRSAPVQAWLGEAHLFVGYYSDDDAFRTEAYAAAERSYGNALAINQNYAFAISGLGWILQYQERYDESITQFERALVLNDTWDETHVGLAWSLYYQGNYEQAEQHFRDGLERDTDENYASAHYGLGLTLRDLGRTDEARAEFERALEIDPEYSDAQEALDSLS